MDNSTSLKVLITAGPTREAIDPVRYISNHSSGKMGIAIAESFAKQGCLVTLVLGPTHLTVNNPLVKIEQVTSAKEMYDKCNTLYAQVDVAIFAAAVADYTPKEVATQKVKKNSGEWNIELEKTKDIAQEMGKRKTNKQLNIVFALETNNELENAHAKLIKKNADFVVLNSMQDEGAGFGHDTNKVTLIFKNGLVKSKTLMTKQALAEDICQEVINTYKNL
jgi:phosphopantothenoylcysteine decarboxylase/phosphopantothenate--cysteine ligase